MVSGEYNTFCRESLHRLRGPPPFDKFRKMIWCAMAGIMVVCFLFFGKLFELRTGTMESNLILTALVLIAPAVFRIMLRLLNYGEKIYGYLKGRK